ncbi:MAG: hypothetical protein FD156_1003 [Nitrospirae bacterium]|nr:MAG: hypothetical protein FD156_1003 [Nitrospirota bacterium]
MNEGQMIVEYTPNDKIADLLKALKEKWGIELPVTKTLYNPMRAGWNIVGKAADGLYVPLHESDNIPLSSKELNGAFERFGSISRKIADNFEDDERDMFRGYLMFGMEVQAGSSTAGFDPVETGYYQKMKKYDKNGNLLNTNDEPKKAFTWPTTNEPVDIELCVVVAIAGG